MRKPLSTDEAARDPRGEFPVDAPTYLFHLFTVITRHRDAKLEKALQPLGLNLSRHRALSVIARLAPCTMSELAEFSAVDRTTMTRTVDQLVEAGLVERTTPREDRRQVVLTVTLAGAETCRRSLRVIYRANREFLVGLGGPRQRQLARAFEAILANLVADPELRARLMLRRTDER